MPTDALSSHSPSCPTETFPRMDRELSDIATPQKLARQPSCTHPLPDISILESYPTHEFGFDIGASRHPDRLRDRQTNGVWVLRSHPEGPETA